MAAENSVMPAVAPFSACSPATGWRLATSDCRLAPRDRSRWAPPDPVDFRFM
jgi:hypothetical protein